MDNYIFIDNKKFNTLVAISNEEKSKGLMYYSWPPPIMSFPYKRSDIRKFWMAETISPLDIIFCKNGMVIDIQYGKPLDQISVGPDEPVDLVIEMPYGSVKNENICIGSKVEIKYSVSTLAKKYALENVA